MKQQYNHEDIDDLFHNRYGDAGIQIPGEEELWLKIEGKQKDRKGAWLFMSFGLIILGTGLIYMYFSSMNSDIDNENVQTSAIEYDQPERSINSVREEIDITELNSVSKKAKSKSVSTSLPIAVETIKRISTDLPKEKSRGVFKKNVLDVEREIIAPIKLFEQRQNVDLNIMPIAEDENTDNNELIVLELLKVEEPGFLSVGMLAKELEKYPVVIEPISRKTKRGIYLEIAGGAFLPQNSFSIIPEGNILAEDKAKSFEALWRQHFKPISTVAIAGKLGFNLNQKLSTYIGLNYNRTLSRFEELELISERTITYSPEAFVIDDIGGKTYFGEEVFSQRTFTRKTVEKVVESQLNIPIGLSYQIAQISKFSFSLDAALLVRLRKTYNGKFLSSDLELIDVGSENMSDFVDTDTSFDYQFGGQFLFNQNSNFEYFIAPQAIFGLSNTLKNNSYVKHKRRQFGVQLGVRYIIN